MKRLLQIIALATAGISLLATAQTVGPNTAISWIEESLPADADGLRLLCDGVQAWEGTAPPVLISDFTLPAGAFQCGLVYFNAVGNGPMGGTVTGLPVSSAPTQTAPNLFLIQIP